MKRLTAYFLAILLLPALLPGQTLHKDVPDLEFARFDRNRIVMKGDSSCFETVYKKLDSILMSGEGHLSIMHIGGSHVQAGTLTRQFRNDLLSMGGDLDGGRGLVFPFWAARTNTPSSFKTRYGGEWTASRNVQKNPEKRLGLTGMALTSSDSSAFVRIVLKARNAAPDEPEFRFDRVKVLGYQSGGDRCPVIVQENNDTLSGTWDEGSSSWSFILPEPKDSVTVALGGRDGELTLTGIFLDNGRPGISVTEIGVNGAALSSYARCQDLERDLKMVNPDLVIFGIGINDAVATDFSKEVFISRYRDLVDRIRSVNPDCALLFITNNDSYRRIRRRVYSVNRNALPAEEAFFEITEGCGGGVWDFFEIMGGLESMKRWEAAGLAKQDKVHFTEEGYSLIGNLLYNALMDKFEGYRRRKG